MSQTKLPLSTRLTGLVAAKVIRGWMSTLACRAYFYDRSLDPHLGCERPRIYLVWHEYMLIPLYMRPQCNTATLMSRHRSADILHCIARLEGFECVRGSTSRGGAAALLDLARHVQEKHLVITPDGPRGPRRVMAVGPIYLASKLGVPIVPLGFGLNRLWRVNSWDRFAIAQPFAQARCVAGTEIFVPPELNRDGLEAERKRIERIMNSLTTDAENWAAAGTYRVGEVVETRRPRLLRKPHIVEPVRLFCEAEADDACELSGRRSA